MPAQEFLDDWRRHAEVRLEQSQDRHIQVDKALFSGQIQNAERAGHRQAVLPRHERCLAFINQRDVRSDLSRHSDRLRLPSAQCMADTRFVR